MASKRKPAKKTKKAPASAVKSSTSRARGDKHHEKPGKNTDRRHLPTKGSKSRKDSDSPVSKRKTKASKETSKKSRKGISGNIRTPSPRVKAVRGQQSGSVSKAANVGNIRKDKRLRSNQQKLRSLSASKGWETRRHNAAARIKREAIAEGIAIGETLRKESLSATAKEALAKKAKAREALYTPQKAPPEPKATLSPPQAENAVKALVDRLSQHYRHEGIGTFPAIVRNADETIDAEVLLATMQIAAEATDQHAAMKKILYGVSRALPNTFPQEIWFSVRIDFVAGEPVGDDNDFFPYSTHSIEDIQALDQDRWSGDRLQLLWQHGRAPLHGHVVGAAEALAKVLEARESFYPVVSAIAVKFHWNQYLVKPPTLR